MLLFVYNLAPVWKLDTVSCYAHFWNIQNLCSPDKTFAGIKIKVTITTDYWSTWSSSNEVMLINNCVLRRESFVSFMQHIWSQMDADRSRSMAHKLKQFIWFGVHKFVQNSVRLPESWSHFYFYFFKFIFGQTLYFSFSILCYHTVTVIYINFQCLQLHPHPQVPHQHRTIRLHLPCLQLLLLHLMTLVVRKHFCFLKDVTVLDDFWVLVMV